MQSVAEKHSKKRGKTCKAVRAGIFLNKMLHKSNFSIEAAVANCSRAMETDTISKNGRSLKSQTSRENKFLYGSMKKGLLILVALIGFGVSTFGQNVVIQTNESNKSEKKDDCAYRIAGICTTEDIGGVEVSTSFAYNSDYYLEFENYNNFTVSVIYEYVTNGDKKTGTIVLKANEKKKTTNAYYRPSDFKLIGRKLNN